MLKQENCQNHRNLKKALDEESFAAYDTLLYLDTHPTDEHALAYFREHQKRRLELLEMYTKSIGPLTADSAADSDCSSWKWSEQPFPWEQEGGCR